MSHARTKNSLGRLYSHLLWTPDATYDIGASGANRPRNLYLSGDAVIGGDITVSGVSDGPFTVTTANAAALAVGANGNTNPVLRVGTDTGSVKTGLLIQGAAEAGGLALSVITSGTNEDLTIDAAGSGTITLGGTSTGVIAMERDATIANGFGLIIGNATQITNLPNGLTPELEILGTGGNDSNAALGRWSADSSGPGFSFVKSRSGTIGTATVVQDNDVVGDILWGAADGANHHTVVAQIRGEVDDASPASNSIGGALIFSTAAGTSSDDITESFRIDNAQRMILGRGAGTVYGTNKSWLDIVGNQGSDGTMGINVSLFSASAAETPLLNLQKSNHGTLGNYTAVDDQDELGRVNFKGSDSGGFIVGASVYAEATATASSNSISGRLIFATTNAGTVPTDRLTIDETGAITIAAAASQIIPGATSFAIRNNADTANNLLILDNGNVGLGGTSPTTTLGIQKSTSSVESDVYPGIRIQNDSTATASYVRHYMKAGTAILNLLVDGVVSNHILFGTESSHPLKIQTNSVVRLTLAATGLATFTGRVITDDTTESTSATTGSIQTDGGLGVAKDLFLSGVMRHGAAGSLTIASGAVAVTKTFHTLVVEGGAGAGADTLVTATGGAEGDILILKTTTSGANDQVTVSDTTGADTFVLAGADFVMDHIDDRLICIHNGTEWVEISRSSNS